MRACGALLEILKNPLDFGIGCSLHVEIDGGVDLETALVDAFFAKPRDELAPDVLLEEAAVRFLVAQRIGQRHFRVTRLVELIAIDGARVEHRLQDTVRGEMARSIFAVGA